MLLISLSVLLLVVVVVLLLVLRRLEIDVLPSLELFWRPPGLQQHAPIQVYIPFIYHSIYPIQHT